MKSKAIRDKVLFLDTNVFVYSRGSDHQLKHPCQKVLKAATSGNLDLHTSVEVLQELLYRYARIGRRKLGIEISAAASDLLHPILPVNADDVGYAILLMERYSSIKSRDAIHAAVALNNGIRHIISADKDFDIIKEIKRVDPLELFPG